VRPLYAAKLEDLGPADRIKVECGSCRRVGLIAAAGLGLPLHTSVLDLKALATLPATNGRPMSPS
jgi:hypothetical protein